MSAGDRYSIRYDRFSRLTSLPCYHSGQISERQWREHLKDEVFRAWLEKQGHTTPT